MTTASAKAERVDLEIHAGNDIRIPVEGVDMNLLTQVREQFQSLTRPKAISHNPDLAGRVHVYRQGANQVVQALDSFADYATVYSTYAWVQKAIAKISENIAGLPVRVVNSEDKAIEGHPLTELFAHVNDEDTPIDLWGAYVIHMMIGGETFYQFVPDSRGRPVEIWLRRPDCVGIYPDLSRLEYPAVAGYLYEPMEAETRPIAIEPRWMAHDKFYNPLNPWRGVAPIHAVREGITIDLFAQAWSKHFLRNSARPDFAIIAPQGITQSEKDRIEQQFIRNHQGMDRWHLPAILEEGVTDIKTFSFPPKDIEWLQQREFSRDEVGAIFGVPDEIMGYGKDTYENFQTALEVFWTLTLLPLIRRRDTVLTHHLSRFGLGLRPGERIATDLSSVGVLQEDLAPKLDHAMKLWQMGVPFNTLDKALKLGIGDVPGGEVGYLQGTLKPVDQILNPPPPPPMPMLPGRGEPPVDDEPADEQPDEEPRERFYLPEGAKEQAKRALKKLIQQCQDADLRALREGKERPHPDLDLGELQRWLGDRSALVVANVERAIDSITGNHDEVNEAYNWLKRDESLARLLEVEAATHFFTGKVLVGAITPNVYKALLQLDPDDDEAEQHIRLEIERRTERELTQAFREQLTNLLPDDAGDDAIRAAVNRVEATSEPVREVLRRELEAASSLGVTVALDTLGQVGIGFDWTLAHTDAARWASQYSYELVRDINRTTQARLQQAVDDWFRERTTLRDLKRELEPTFGRRRARLIAQTETTRAASEGSVIAYEQSGVVHEAEWYTARDERVCVICGGLHGKRASLRGTFDGQPYPPAHPGCRCFVRPIIDEPSQLQPVTTQRPTPQGTPVSGALKLPSSGKYRPIYQEALAAIDAVHGDGTLPELPVMTKSNMDAYGHYRFVRSGKPVEIAINGQGSHHQLTLAHEIGHFLDHQAIGKQGEMASEKDALLEGWRKAVDNSEAVQRLKDKRRNPMKYRAEVDVAGSRYILTPDTVFMGYLLDRRELWARSYAQYIAQRSGNATMLAQLAAERVDPIYGDRQWDDEDFAPIAAAIDELFRGLGWLQ